MSHHNHIPVILSACRTAIGELLGGLSPVPAPQLGAICVREAVKRAGIEPEEVQEVLMGNVIQAGVGQAPARQAAMFGGIPDSVPAVTINKVCGSGLKAVMLAAQAIKAGDLDCAVAGGMESMSNAPFLIKGARQGYKYGDQKIQDAMLLDGLWDCYNNFHMGEAAEIIAEKYNVTREQMDEYSLKSHQKAIAAIKNGKFKDEIVPAEVPQRKGDPILFEIDERPREETTLEKLASLRPAFRNNGSVTAGNAPGLNDGGSALVVTSLELAERRGIQLLARITGYAAAGIEPKMLFYAPVLAVRQLLEKTGKTIVDYDLIEINEAFAAQTIVDGNELGWDWERVNVNGGAVALGHPIGASGARCLTTLLYAMKDRGARTGLVTLCLGGGNAVAMSVEMQ